MDSRIYSFNYKDKEKTWPSGFLYDGVHNYDTGSIAKDEYFALRQSFVDNNFSKIKSINPAQSIDDYLGMSMMERMRQNATSQKAWERIHDIIGGQDGTVMSMDIETVGDIVSHSRKPAAYTGITEMGFAFQNFKNGFMNGDATRFTLVDGFSDVQKKAALDVLNAYKQSGWNALNEQEQWLMKIMSSYGEYNFQDTFRQVEIPAAGLDGKKFWALSEKAEQVIGDHTNFSKISKGIANWSTLYQRTVDSGISSNIDAGVQYMAEILNENKIGIVSANSAYEATVLGNKLRQFGSSGEVLMNNSADVVYASTAISRTNAMSSFRMQMEALGRGSDPSAPNSVASLNIASGINEAEIHHGASDALQQIKNATSHVYYGDKPFSQLAIEAGGLQQTGKRGGKSSKNIIDDLDYGDKYFYMSNGYMDKNNIDTIVTTMADGTETASQDGSIRGRYYIIDEDGSGWTKFNPMTESSSFGTEEDVYVLRMQDAADSERAVYKGFYNKNEADKWVEKNMIGVSQDRLSQADIDRQTKLSEIEIGRRKFDSFFNASDTYASKSGYENGGFNELKTYLEMAEASRDGDFTEQYKRSLGLSGDASYDDVLRYHGITSNYQKIEYENAMKRVRSEQSMLSAIVNDINESGRNTNIQKTAALKEIRDKYIGSVESLSAGYTRAIRDGKGNKEMLQRSGFTLQDAFSLDVRINDDVRRINGSTYDNLVSSLNNAYRDASKQDIINSIDELLSRTDSSGNHLLSKKNASVFINLKDYLSDIHVPEASHYNTIHGDLAVAMDTVFFKPVRENTEGPFKYFSSNNRGDNKSLRFINNLIGDSIELNEETLYTYAGGVDRSTPTHSLDQLFQSGIGMSRDELKAASREAVERVNKVKVISGKGGDVISQMSQQLGYSSSQASKIADMFGTGTNDKKYAITKHPDIQYHIIMSDKPDGNAYGIFTTRKHANAVEKKLLDGDFDASTIKALEQSFEDQAGVVEFKALHRTKLLEVDNITTAKKVIQAKNGSNLNVFNGDATAIKSVLGDSIYLTTVSQGALQEKFAMPEIESYVKNGKLSGGFLQSGDALINAIRMRFGSFLEAIEEERFSSATRSIRNAQTEAMIKWSSPNGRRTLNGQMYSLNDMLRGFQINTDGLATTLRNELELSLRAGDLDESPLVKLVQGVAYQEGILDSELTVGNMDQVLKDSRWEEFYHKNLIISNVNEDQAVKTLVQTNKDVYGVMAQDKFSKNLLGIMIDQHDALMNRGLVYSYKNKYGKEIFPVREGLENIRKLSPYLSQLTSPDHMDGMTLINSAQIIDMGALNPSMRPTFNQILNALYFDPETLDKDVMDRLSKVDVRIGSASQSLTEYALMNNISGLNITSPNGVPYNKMEREFTTTFKQMSDAELLLKYKELNRQYNAGKGVFDPSTVEGQKYRRAYEIFREENPSMHEGKMFGSSEFLNQTPFTSSDIKKIQRSDLRIASDRDSTLRDAFLRHLDENGEMKVREGKEMFQHKYKSYIWNGPETTLTKQNIEDLLDAGETRILPDVRMQNDIKVEINQEKSMMHFTQIDDRFVKRSENSVFGATFRSSQEEIANAISEAKRYQGLVMDLITEYDGTGYRPMFIGNLAGFKHGNQMGLSSTYSTIINEYSKVDGGLADLVAVMNKTPGFDQMDVFLDNGKIITNQRDKAGLEQAIIGLETLLRNGEGNKIANKRLFGSRGNNGILQKMSGNNYMYLSMQRMNVNEVTADRIFFDERMAQSVRLRSQDEFYEGMENWADPSIEERYIKAIRENALSGNDAEVEIATGRSTDSKEINDFLRRSSEDSANQLEIERWSRTHQSQAEVVDSMWNSVKFYAGELDAKEVNAYVVNLDDILDSFDDPKSIGVMDIKEKMFKIEGELPEYLKNTDVIGSPKSIYFKFNKPIVGEGHYDRAAKRMVGGMSFDGVLLPLYDIRTLPNGELNFTESQKAIARFFDVYNEERMNLSTNKKAITEAFDKMMTGLQEELDMYSKDSFLYKTHGRFMLPNSRQLLAQDEMSPMVEELWKDSRLAKGVKREKKIYADIQKHGINEAYISELDEIAATRKEILGKIADRIEIGEQTKGLYEVSNLKAIGMEKRAIEMVDGRYMFANAVGMNSNTMKKMGMNQGLVGYQVFSEIENGTRWYETSKEFKKYIKSADGYTKDVERVSQYFTNLGVSSDIQDPGKRLMRQINEYSKLNIDNSMSRTARSLQEIENNRVIMDAMEVFGKRYLTDVGTIGEHWRPPVFSAQTNVRIYLDESVGDGQVRDYTGGITSIQNNVDHDGDTKMVSFMLDKKGGMLRLYDDAGNIAENKMGLAYRTYYSNLGANNKIMAKLIREGDAFKVDPLNDYWIAGAKEIEKFDNDKFIGGVEKFMASKGIEGNAQDFADGLSKGRFAEMAYSPEMRQAVTDFYTNHSFTQDVPLLRAAITARVRKENIGAISTPNYKLRDTLLMIQDMYRADGDEAGWSLARSIVSDLTGIGSDKLLDITEQKAIDVKHIVDAINVAQTGKWTSGMGKLFNARKNIDVKNQGLRQMMEAVNASTFKMNARDLDSVYEEIINGSRDAFRKELQETGSSMAELKLQFRSLYEAADLKYATEIQNSVLRRSRTYLSGVSDFVLEYQRIAESVGGNGGSTMGDLSGFAKAFTDSRVIADRYGIYSSTPTVMNGVSRQGFYQMTDATSKGSVHHVIFQEIDMSALSEADPANMKFKYTGNVLETTGTAKEINKWLRSVFTEDADRTALEQLNAYMLTDMPEAKAAHVRTANETRIPKQLEEFIVDTESYRKFLRMNKTSQKQFGEKEYEFLSKLFGNEDDLAETRQLLMDYRQWKETKGINSGSGKDLMRAMNEQIASQYHNGGQDFGSYNEQLRKLMSSNEFGMSENLIPEMRAQRSVLKDFDINAFEKTISELREGIYDLKPSEDVINVAFDGIDASIETAKHLRRPDTEISQIVEIAGLRNTAIDEAQKAIRENNQTVIDAFQTQLFGTRQKAGMITAAEQVDMLFNWGSADKGVMKVGFGKYAGVSFKDLTGEQVQEILDSAKSVTANNAMHRHAIDMTAKNLDGFTATATKSMNNEKVFAETMDIAQRYINKAGEISPETGEAVINAIQNPRQGGGMKHKKLGSVIGDGLKNVDMGKLMKGSAIVAGAMAAIGVANNLLHKDNHKSPLSPEFSNNNNDPGFKDGAAHPDVQPRKQRGGSGKMYAEPRGNGNQLKFKVNAKTQSRLSDQSNARLISMANNGQGDIMVNKDTSRINDNWLANKFAQLSL